MLKWQRIIFLLYIFTETKNMKRLFRRSCVIASFLFVASSFVFSSCKKSKDDTASTGSPGTNEVWMQNNAFTPSTISVAVNTTIIWTNKDGVSHTVNSDAGSDLNSGNMGNGGTYSHQFTAIGTFAYHCNIHSSMHGTVTVH